MKFTIRRKLQWGFGVVLTFMALLGYYAWHLSKSFSFEFSDLYENNLRGAIELTETERGLWELRFGLPNYLTGDQTSRSKIRASTDQWIKQVEENMTAFEKKPHSPEEMNLIAQWKITFEAYQNARPGFFDLVDAGKIEDAKEYRANQTNPPAVRAVEILSKLNEIQGKRGDNKENAIMTNVKTSTFLIAVVLVLSLFTGIFLSIFISRSITRPIEMMVRSAEKMSAGDLTQAVEIRSNDELAVLNLAFLKMADNLRTTLKNIQTVSHNIASASQQIGTSSQSILEREKAHSSLTATVSSSIHEVNSAVKEVVTHVESLSSSAELTSSSAAEMATSIQYVAGTTREMNSKVGLTAASIVEINSSINDVARNIEQLSTGAGKTAEAVQDISISVKEIEKHSKEAAALSEKVSADAKGIGMISIEKTMTGIARIRETVETSVNTISALGQRSEQIGDILTVIDQVTKQTSLLALNAAILAAQAGEQGKGFSVVADEIKTLADQSASSTRDISQVICDVQKEVQHSIEAAKEGFKSVEEGIKLSEDSHQALQIILESSSQSNAKSLEIEHSAKKQSEKVSEIVLAINQINNMIQQINEATSRQKTGSEQILVSSENVRSGTEVIQGSIQEQADESTHITQAIENVTERVRQILRAVMEQQSGIQTISTSFEEIESTALKNVEAAEEMNEVVKVLSQQSLVLKSNMERFKF